MAKAKSTPIEDYKKISADIQKGEVTPIYILDGDETYFVDELTDDLEQNVLPDDAKEFSLFTYYGNDINHADLISACHQSSFFSPQIVVVVREAQNLKGFDKLQNYFEKPNPNCTLVLAFKNKKADSRTKAFKAAMKNGTYFNSRTLYDNEVKAWLTDYIKNKGFKITPVEIEILYSYLGGDLGKLSNEVDKIALNLEPGANITQADIEKYIGISKDYNIYALSKAITNRDSKELYRMLHHFEANPKTAPMMMVLSVMTNFYLQLLQYHAHKGKDKFSLAKILKINPYFVQDLEKAARFIDPTKAKASLLLIYDYNKKAIGIGSQEKSERLLTEMMVRLFHA